MNPRKTESELASMKKNMSTIFSFSMLSNAEKSHLLLPGSHHIKGLSNDVFCRNLAVRNPAGTRLDSLAW